MGERGRENVIKTSNIRGNTSLMQTKGGDGLLSVIAEILLYYDAEFMITL